MTKSGLTIAQQVATAALAFQKDRTGHTPRAATVVISGDTLVITMHEALSEAERVLSKNPGGAARVQEFHRILFNASAEPLRKEIERITGMSVREAASELEPATGAVVHVFTSGTMVQVFLLERGTATEEWSASALGSPATVIGDPHSDASGTGS